MDIKIRKLLAENNITSACYQSRLHRGWAPDKAVSIPMIEQSRGYKVYKNMKCLGTFTGAAAAAKFLSRQLQYNITKNMIIGKFYRSYGADINIDEFIIRRVAK